VTLRLARDAFLRGYRMAYRGAAADDAGALLRAVGALDPDLAPFAFEGAAMAWTVREARERSVRFDDLVTSAEIRWRPFLALGMGCAQARLGRPIPDEAAAQDGYGFLHGLLDRSWRPGGEGTSRRVERGRGRALWFTTEGDAEACRRLIGDGACVSDRWRGVAIACAFAGDPRGHASLLPRAAGDRDVVAEGAREALRLWRSLGTPPRHVLEVVEAVDRGPAPQ